MSTRAQRQAILDAIRDQLGQINAGHGLTDEESELAELGLRLDAEEQRFAELFDRDPLRAVWFGQ